MKLSVVTDGRVMGTPVVNSQQTDDCEEDESNMSVAEHDGGSDSDSDDASADASGANKEETKQGLFDR